MHRRTRTVNRHLILIGIVVGLIAICTGVARSADAPADGSLRIANDENTVSIFDGKQPVAHYRFTDVPFKPCVQQWFTPSGINVLRDSPHDHKHHHALMFAVSVDGVDFWSEAANCGKQQHRSLTNLGVSTGDGVTRARFTQQIDWTAPNVEKPLAAERRTIEAWTADDLDASLLVWHTHLEPAGGRESITLGGSHYFGLGLRFIESMDGTGKFFYADGKPGEVVRGAERLTHTRWCAYTAPADGKPVTVAVFDHPTNARHPAAMFTMPNFAYISATLNLTKEPLKIEAAKPLELTYAVALWDGPVEPAKIEKLYRWWVKR